MKFRRLYFCALVGTLVFSGFTAPKNKEEISIVTHPVINRQSNLYQGNRAPLQPAHFIKLPMGNIQPGGWLKKLIDLQKDGLCGHLGEISAWLDKKNNAWLAEGGDHGWEEVPYWLRGYSDMAFILNDADMKKEAMIWIEAILKSQKPNGWFGPEVRNGKEKHLDFWSNMLVLFTFQNYYECTHDRRVIDFMTKYFRYELSVPDEAYLSSYWEDSRGGDNLYSIYWLYNITGDKFLLDLAEKTHRCTANWMQKSSLPNWHNVNIAQCFREPATWFMQSGDSAHLAATYNDYNLIRRTFTDPMRNSNLLKEATGIAQIAMHDPEVGDEVLSNVYVANADAAKVQRITTSSANDNNRISDRFVEDASYLRIKNISLGYTFPQKWLRRLQIDHLRLYVNIQNLCTITGYKGYDPEIGALNYNVLLRGVDDARYPSQRIYTFGLNFNF